MAKLVRELPTQEVPSIYSTLRENISFSPAVATVIRPKRPSTSTPLFSDLALTFCPPFREISPSLPTT